MRTARVVAASALLALPASASAADWWWVQGSDRSRSMVERNSIARSGSWATAWTQDFFLSPRGVDLFSARYLVQHDRARGHATVLSAQAFDGNGRPVAAPAPDRSPARADDLQEICDDDGLRAARVGDLEREVRMWRLPNDN